MISAKIKQIATSAREWAEKTNAELGHPYHDDLMGMCAIASMHLTNQLRRAKLHRKHDISIAYNDNHCFVLVDGVIVDITATQFDAHRNEKVFVQKHEHVDHRWYYKKERSFKEPKELKKYLKKKHWPSYQISTKHVDATSCLEYSACTE